jgi:hypothetical protein
VAGGSLKNVFILFFCFACSLSASAEPLGSIPHDFEVGDYSKYETIDSLIDSFKASGAVVTPLENGQVIDIAYYLPTPKSPTVSDLIRYGRRPNGMEAICEKTINPPAITNRFRDNSGTLRPGDWYYLGQNGGPRVSFSEQVKTAFAALKANSSKDPDWKGSWGNILITQHAVKPRPST